MHIPKGLPTQVTGLGLGWYMNNKMCWKAPKKLLGYIKRSSTENWKPDLLYGCALLEHLILLYLIQEVLMVCAQYMTVMSINASGT